MKGNMPMNRLDHAAAQVTTALEDFEGTSRTESMAWNVPVGRAPYTGGITVSVEHSGWSSIMGKVPQKAAKRIFKKSTGIRRLGTGSARYYQALFETNALLGTNLKFFHYKNGNGGYPSLGLGSHIPLAGGLDGGGEGIIPLVRAAVREMLDITTTSGKALSRGASGTSDGEEEHPGEKPARTSPGGPSPMGCLDPLCDLLKRSPWTWYRRPDHLSIVLATPPDLYVQAELSNGGNGTWRMSVCKRFPKTVKSKTCRRAMYLVLMRINAAVRYARGFTGMSPGSGLSTAGFEIEIAAERYPSLAAITDARGSLSVACSMAFKEMENLADNEDLARAYLALAGGRN